MRQYIGIDPTTGYKLCVDSTSTLRLELPKCPCCGGEGLLSHTSKYGGKHVCKDCGDKWAAYLSARARLKATSSHRVVINQLERINYWLKLKDAGMLVPNGLERDKANLQRYLDFYGLPDHIVDKEPEQRKVTCFYCGCTCIASGYATRTRCPDCDSRYKRYRQLQTNIKTLTIDECEEFGFILSEYADLMRRGFWSPNIPKYRAKLKRRMDELTN